MVIAGHPSGWNAVSASAVGSSHRAKDTPNQDAVATFEIDDGLCVALADGHGGPRYVRSADGARAAVEVARRVGTETLRRSDSLHASAVQLPARLVAGWRAEVAAHLTAHPLDADTVQLVGADPFVAYGATMLLLMRCKE